MDIKQAIQSRHSVRQYMNMSIKASSIDAINKKIEEINHKTGLKICFDVENPDAFTGILARYGHFNCVRNLIVMAGPEGRDKEIGYYGEELVIFAQQLGLNTCWVALTYNRKKVNCKLSPEDKIYVVISVGIGANQGTQHKSKPLNEISNISDECPEWFKNGVECASLAPTAMNQQKFYFEYKDNGVVSKCGRGHLTELDLGIAEYHFDVGSEKYVFEERLNFNGRQI
jgi:hypothetical protein